MLIIAHRGASGSEPENTLRSFKKAIELKADAIELDVHLSKDNKLVVIHDEKVNRTTKGRGKVNDKTLKELKQLNAGKEEKIPTLNEVLKLVKRRVKIHIELKGEGTAKPVFLLIEDYVKLKNWKYSDFFISSFDHKQLNDFLQLTKKIKIGVLFKGKPNLKIAEELNAYSINLSFKQLNKTIIDNAHQKGIKVFTYTITQLEEMNKVKALKVDGVFTNYPNGI